MMIINWDYSKIMIDSMIAKDRSKEFITCFKCSDIVEKGK